MNETLSRIKHYVQMLHDKPLSQMGDVVHGVHTGTEWEAELRISDLREVLNLIEELKDALTKQDEYKAALQFIYGWFPTNISQPAKQVLEMKEFAFNVLKGNTTTQAEMGRRKGASNE